MSDKLTCEYGQCQKEARVNLCMEHWEEHLKAAAPAVGQFSEEQVKQCEYEADIEMIKRAPKIGEPRKLRYDAHVERRQILTDNLNALLRSEAAKEPK